MRVKFKCPTASDMTMGALLSPEGGIFLPFWNIFREHVNSCISAHRNIKLKRMKLDLRLLSPSVEKCGYRSKYFGPFESHGDISVRLKKNPRLFLLNL